MYSPSNSSASNLPFGLPPHISTFLPKTEAINATIGHQSQENAETRVLGNQKEELHHQEYRHSGRYFATSNQVDGGENTSQSCQYVPPDVPSNGDDGTKQHQVKVYLCDPRLNRNNGRQGFPNPHVASHHDQINSGQESQMTSDSWSKQVQEKPLCPLLPTPSTHSTPPLPPPLSFPPPPPLPPPLSLPPPPSLPPILSTPQEPMPALPISGPADHRGNKWKPKACYQIFQSETITPMWNTSSTGHVFRDQSTSMVPCSLSVPFPVYCFNCQEVGHETRQCSIGKSAKEQSKRKLENESQECRKRTKKGNNAKECPNSSIETQEIESSAEKPCVSRWATGANAVAPLAGRKTPVVGVSTDNNPGAAGSSKMEQSLQENFVTKKNITNATISVEAKSLIYEDSIDKLLASARLAAITKTNFSEKSNSSSSNTISTPNAAETDVRNINSCLPNIASAERPSGSKDDGKGNEKAEIGNKKEKANDPVCNLCNKKNGAHVQGCYNSKKARALRKQEIQHAEELAKKMEKEKKMSQMFAQIFNKIKNDVPLPAVSVESPSQVTAKKRRAEKEFLARVEFIKRLPREELEEVVLRHIYSLAANYRNSTELEYTKRKVLNLQKHINAIHYKHKRENESKLQQTPKPTRSIGIQVESKDGATSLQQQIPVAVKPPSLQFKVERTEVNITPPSPELSTSKEDGSNLGCTLPRLGNAGVAQSPCDAIVSSSNSINEIVVKTEKQCTPTLRDNLLHPENNNEHQETTVTSHIQPRLPKPTPTHADTPSKPTQKTKTDVASNHCHPPKQQPSPADLTNLSAKSYQLPKERSTNSSTNRTMGHLEQPGAFSSSTLHAEISNLSARMTLQRQQPSATSNSYQQTDLCNHGIQQKSQRIENVQSTFQLIKSENIKIEVNKPIERIGASNQRSNMHVLGSRELPIEIE